jgi:hypothetical protein
LEKYLVGWHKFAFAATRFINLEGLKIFPVYFLRGDTKLFLFVFPQFRFYESGVILNDSGLMVPKYSFVVSLS